MAPEPEPVQEESVAEGVRTFTVDPTESQASYIVDEEFFADALGKLGIEAGDKVVVGTTTGVTGQIQLNPNNPDMVEAAQFTVDMRGLATDQDRRDKWLRENAIESDVFPVTTFTAVSATGLPASITDGEPVSFQLNGDLTVRDVTKNVTFDVTASISGDTLEGTATLSLNMTDFGIDPPSFANTLTVADPFTIEVTLTAREG
jgi:polyisoprenoid-binding protein YceI